MSELNARLGLKKLGERQVRNNAREIRLKPLFPLAIIATACGCGGGGAGDTTASSIAGFPSNSPPVAVIESSTNNFVAGTAIELSSAGSSDSDGDALSSKWRLESPVSSFAQLDSSEGQKVQFEPDMAGNFTVYLEVSDGKGGIDQSSLTVAANLPTPDSLPNFSSTAPPSPTIADRADATKLLYQGTFGPKDGDVELLVEMGAQVWFEQQISMEPHLYTTAWGDIAEEFGDVDDGDNANFKQLTHEAFMVNALSSPDQLRQRMTYALSQLFVISDQFDFAGQDRLILGFADVLHRNAFGNYRTLLKEVTLHPAMGMYLAMLGNKKADPENNIRPDENFAREIMQLFTIGLALINQDGSLILDEATEQPSQTYGQVDVQNYAAALTGWYFSNQESYKFGDIFHSIAWEDRIKPMSAYDEFHQKTHKKLLRNYYVPAGASADESLDTVLDSLFYHPNLGPFIATHLIKSLVTSNPSAAYIERVATVFNSDENRERGNLASVVQAVLFDPEARGISGEAVLHRGKIKDPLLKYINFSRLFQIGSYRNNRSFLKDRPSQTFLGAQSVFNFYSPTHVPNLAFAQLGLVAPELEVITAETIVSDASKYAHISTSFQRDFQVSQGVSDETLDYFEHSPVHDLSPIINRLNETGQESVIDFLDEYMSQRQLTPSIRNYLSEYLSIGLGHIETAEYYSSEAHRTDARHRLLIDLIYLIAISPEYALQPL